MLIFVHGDDTFRSQEKVRQLTDAFRSKFDPTGMNFVKFPAKDDGKLQIGEVLQAVSSAPFLGEKRMVVVRDLLTSLKKADEKMWAEGLSRIPDSTVVIVWESEDVSKKKIFKELSSPLAKGGARGGSVKANVHAYPFPVLEGSTLNQWVARRIAGRGGQADPAAVRELVDRVGSDLWQMDNEIAKLVSFVSSRHSERAESERRDIPISIADVQELVRPSFEGEIFALVDAVSKKQTSLALKLLQQERAAGSNDHYLITMLGRQVRMLLGARALLDENPRTTKEDLAAAMGIHPFPASKALQQARSFTFEDLKRAHDLLFDFDQKTKTGQIDPDLAVDLVAIDLMK